MFKKASLSLLIFLCELFSFTIQAQVIACQNDTNNNTITLTFSLPRYSIHDTILPGCYNVQGLWNYVSVWNNDFGITDSLGLPELPQLTVDLNIPTDAHALYCEISNIQGTTISLNRHVMPNQLDIPKDSTVTYIPVSYDDEFYEGIDTFPKKTCYLADFFFIRNERGLGLTIMPFSYLPHSKTLRIIYSAQITIFYKRTEQHAGHQADSYLWGKYYSHIFKNYPTSTNANTNSGRYLMVVPLKYSSAIESFISYKRNIGYIVDTILLSSRETPTNIKNRIQSKYDDVSSRPDFILLVGGHADLPAYAGDSTSSDVNNPITDLPYALLSGSDLMQDAFIGRWPVSTTQELQAITNKTINTEAHTHLWSKKAVLIAGNDSRSYMRQKFIEAHETVNTDALIPAGFQTNLYQQPSCNTTRTALEWNPMYFVYSGHGSVKAMGEISDNCRINQAFFTGLNNSIPPMVFSFACKTGNFAYMSSEKCIGEMWISNENGSVVFLGSSVTTYPNSDNTIEKKLIGETIHEEDYIGSAVAKAFRKYRNNFWITSSYKKRYTKSYNLQGDPSLLIGGWGCVHNYYIENTSIESGDVHFYHANSTIAFTGSNNIMSGSSILLTAGQEIVFSDGFSSAMGSELSATIESCANLVRQADTIFNDDIENMKSNIQSEPTHIEEASLVVFPNPAEETIQIEYTVADVSGNTNVTISIIDLYGRMFYTSTREHYSDGVYLQQIAIGQLFPGIYIVNVTTDTSSVSKCIIKNNNL